MFTLFYELQSFYGDPLTHITEIESYFAGMNLEKKHILRLFKFLNKTIKENEICEEEEENDPEPDADADADADPDADIDFDVDFD